MKENINQPIQDYIPRAFTNRYVDTIIIISCICNIIIISVSYDTIRFQCFLRKLLFYLHV